MKSPSFCDWNCLSPSILLSWPNIWQTQSLQRQVLLVSDNMQRQVLLVCDYLWQYPSGGLKHHWPSTCVEKQPFGLIDVPSENVAMEKRKCLQIFFTRSLEGWRQAEVHNIWQNVTPLQLPGHVCTAKAKLCTLCKFRARVTRLSKTLCTCTHSQGLCTVHSAGVYYLDIAFNMQVILVKYIFAHGHMVLLLVTDLSGRFEHLGSTYIHNIYNVKGLVLVQASQANQEAKNNILTQQTIWTRWPTELIIIQSLKENQDINSSDGDAALLRVWLFGRIDKWWCPNRASMATLPE